MKVEIWSDVVCPWCYVGKRNLDAAVAEFDHADEVEIVWKAFELDSRAPRRREGEYAQRLAAKYRVSRAEAEAMIARMVSAGARAGVEMRFDIARPGNTFDAHRLLHVAKAHGRQHELAERLFAATFTEGLPIGDAGALVPIAVEAGLPEPEVRSVLDGEAGGDAVRRDEREAVELGVQGVPFFVFDRRYAVSGAQPPDVLLEVLEKTWREAHPIEVVTDDGAGLCDDDSCVI